MTAKRCQELLKNRKERLQNFHFYPTTICHRLILLLILFLFYHLL